MRGRGVGFGWKARHEESKLRILQQLKVYIQQLRDLTPPKEGYVGALHGCYAYDLRIPVIRDGFKSADSVHEFHRLLRENIEQITGADEKRKADFERLVTLQNACSKNTHFSHGDLSAHNILVEEDEITGIIDWDTSGWYPDYWEYARRKCDSHPFEGDWSNETDQFLQQFPDAVEMENLRIELFGRF
jgi:thiamine kinase-like enzyme